MWPDLSKLKSHPVLKLVVLLAVGTLLWWSFARAAPFYVKNYVEPSSVKAGETVFFTMPAYRDLGRDCSVKWSRHLIDSISVRHDLREGERFMSAEALRSMSEAMGQTLKTAALVPDSAAPGRAVLVTNLRFTCNPVQVAFPIEVTLFFPFEVRR